jgi:hypothetical protein
MSGTVAKAEPLLDSALAWAAAGHPVFPCHYVASPGRCSCGKDECLSPAKHPLTQYGVKDATTDPAVIEQWWRQWSLANVAAACVRMTVLDVDVKHHVDGEAQLSALERQHGTVPETGESRTGSGGRHLRFQLAAELKPSSGLIAPGLDIRTGPGSYILVAPSRNLAGVYADHPDRPILETAPAAMPRWLVALAMRYREDDAGDNGTAPRRSSDEWAELLAGAPEGQRRDMALAIAGHYLGQGIAEAEVMAILIGYAGRCIPPFPEREARVLVRDLARRDRTKGPRARAVLRLPETAAADDGLGLVPLGELLSEPDEAHAWVVEGRLPASGLGLLAGKPKAGKSTAARCLALAVARGAPWLGFATTQGPVIYLALEEKRAEVREHFRALGATEDDSIYLLCASAPDDALARLRVEVERRRPVLIIIDPLFRFVRVEDGNDYATMTAALEPLMTLARETGAHVLLVHHLGKGERSDGDNVLGSTAIFGAVDSALLMKRTERYRTLASIQRYGEDMEEITLALDPDTRNVSAGGTRAAAEQDDAARLILEFLAPAVGSVTEAELDDAVECRTRPRRAALRALVAAGTVARTGRGGKADPFRYGIAESAGTRIPERGSV